MLYCTVEPFCNFCLTLKLTLFASIAHRMAKLPPCDVGTSNQRSTPNDLQKSGANSIDRVRLSSWSHLIQLGAWESANSRSIGRWHAMITV